MQQLIYASDFYGAENPENFLFIIIYTVKIIYEHIISSN